MTENLEDILRRTTIFRRLSPDDRARLAAVARIREFEKGSPLFGVSHRLMELTTRLTELTGGRVEARLARFLLKLTDDIGQRRPEGVFIPLALSRQELADMIGTTIETSIRIMSRWGKEDVVRTEKDGFVVVDRAALETVSLT